MNRTQNKKIGISIFHKWWNAWKYENEIDQSEIVYWLKFDSENAIQYQSAIKLLKLRIGFFSNKPSKYKMCDFTNI